MTNALHAAEPVSLQASAAWSWLMETAAAISKSLRLRRALSPVESDLYAAVEALGAVVLDTQDVADLHSRMYAIARDPRFIAWEVQVFRHFDFSTLPAPGAVERSFADAFGPTHLARECARLLAARVDAVAQAVAGLDSIDLPVGAPNALSSALSDFRTPPVLRSLVEETVAGEVALLALLASLMDADRWPCAPWLQLALMEQIRLASVSHLRLLSIFPKVQIPEAVLPVDERIEADALEREARERSRFVLPAELPVGRGYVARLQGLIESDSAAPPGVGALFSR